jgi:hypothetical protein
LQDAEFVKTACHAKMKQAGTVTATR